MALVSASPVVRRRATPTTTIFPSRALARPRSLARLHNRSSHRAPAPPPPALVRAVQRGDSGAGSQCGAAALTAALARRPRKPLPNLSSHHARAACLKDCMRTVMGEGRAACGQPKAPPPLCPCHREAKRKAAAAERARVCRARRRLAAAAEMCEGSRMFKDTEAIAKYVATIGPVRGGRAAACCCAARHYGLQHCGQHLSWARRRERCARRVGSVPGRATRRLAAPTPAPIAPPAPPPGDHIFAEPRVWGQAGVIGRGSAPLGRRTKTSHTSARAARTTGAAAPCRGRRAPLFRPPALTCLHRRHRGSAFPRFLASHARLPPFSPSSRRWASRCRRKKILHSRSSSDRTSGSVASARGSSVPWR